MYLPLEIIILMLVFTAVFGLALGLTLKPRTGRTNARGVALRVFDAVSESPAVYGATLREHEQLALDITKELTGVNLPRIPHEEIDYLIGNN